MARKLLNEYGFSKDNVKVLLGGWGEWKNQNSANSAAYPITILATPAPGGQQPPPVVINPGNSSPIVITPAP